MKIQELIQRSHSAAKEKGFWDTERNQAECFALIISELYEALEAHRKGRFADLVKYIFLLNDRNRLIKERNEYQNENREPLTIFVPDFESYIKDTFEDELADVLIRLFDFCGGYGLQLSEYDSREVMQYDFKNVSNIAEKILIMTNVFTKAYYLDTMKDCVNLVYNYTMYLSLSQNIDIETHIDLKLQYNATRAKLHGKKY